MRIVQIIPFIFLLFPISCSQAVQVDRPSPQTTLADTAPGLLTVEVGINEGGYDAASATAIQIAIQFFAGGKLVQFRAGETLACNGGAATRLITGFSQTYPASSIAGKPFSCRYTAANRSASLRFLVPPMPRIASPSERATVQRSKATIIRFQGEQPISGIVALGMQNKAMAHITAPGIATVDTSQFAPGAGSISLTAFPTVNGISAPAFAAIHVNCTAVAFVDVAWA